MRAVSGTKLWPPIAAILAKLRQLGQPPARCNPSGPAVPVSPPAIQQPQPPIPHMKAWGDRVAAAAVRALNEMPYGEVQLSASGSVYVHTFHFEASFVRGRWRLGDSFTWPEKRAMTVVEDRAERAAIVAIARAALGVPRTDATFV
jgi:hypothetical protein